MKFLFKNRWFTRIGTKVFFISFLSVLSALFLIGIIAYSGIYTVIKDNQEKELLSSSMQVEENLKLYMKNIQTQLLFLSNKDVFQALAADDYTFMLNSMMRLYSEDIQSVYVINKGDLITAVPYGYKYAISNERRQIISEETIKSGFWWSEPYDLGLGSTVTVAKAFHDPRTEDNIVVALDINTKALIQFAAAAGKYKSVFVFSQGAELISSSMNPSLKREYEEMQAMSEELGKLVHSIDNGTTTIFTQDNQWKVLRREDNRWGWIVFAVINETEAYPILTVLRQQVLLLLGVWTVVSLAISYRLSKYIQAPIRVITQQMLSGSLGHLETRINLKRNDEFDNIATSFNRMMLSINDSFEQLKEAEEKKRYHELKALQSQIRPHFLYNTLNAFYCLGEMNRSHEIGELIRSLLQMLRYSIDKVGDIVSIQEEMEHVHDYILLMKLRFGDEFDVDIDIPASLQDVQIPKLTFITLLENSIFYGMQQGDSRNKIRIYCSSDSSIDVKGEVEFAISDTGPGMEPKKVEELFSRRDSGITNSEGLNNLGIRNIHERIQLYFGHSYGLKINTKPNEGFIVYVCIPLKDVS